MTPVGIVLVHGYLGSPDDLELLAEDLRRRFGAEAVACPRLPGHGASTLPAKSFVVRIHAY